MLRAIREIRPTISIPQGPINTWSCLKGEDITHISIPQGPINTQQLNQGKRPHLFQFHKVQLIHLYEDGSEAVI